MELVQILRSNEKNKISLMLKKIDDESETPELISNIFYPDGTNKEKKHLLFSLLRAGIRYACFLDKYHESGEKIYLEEALAHRATIFSSIDQEKGLVLESIERKLLPFWNYEKHLKKRIEDEDTFSEEEIKDYIRFRSSDSLFYCGIARVFCPVDPKIAEIFHNRLMLFDIVDSIKDYEEDMRDEQPNILTMWLLNYLPGNMMPTKLPQALELSRRYRIHSRILDFGRELYQDALNSECLRGIPMLEKDLEMKYHSLGELLK